MTSVPTALKGAALALAVSALGACASSSDWTAVDAVPERTGPAPLPLSQVEAPSPDPRVGLEAGLHDAGEAIWNLRMLSTTPKPAPFDRATNSDLAFMGHYAIQGNYNGFKVWDISDPAHPVLEQGYFCPASQSDVSVYRNLLFVSGEGLSGRIDCGGEGVPTRVSEDRLRGLRIFDISDLENPVNVGNVQTCRGSHTHSVLVDPDDPDNVYVYISGSAPLRPEEELAGCEGGLTDENPETALFRIEVIRVPLADPSEAAIVSSPRIFEDLSAPPRRERVAPADAEARAAALERARSTGAFIGEIRGREIPLPSRFVDPMLDSIAEGEGRDAPTAADSAALREALPGMLAAMFGSSERQEVGPDQCHDITLYPEIGLAGGACEGYGLLLDISDPANPRRLDAVADSNFSYWHSATFNNDGTRVLFTDEWGGGGQPKCRDTDPVEWGANAIFSIDENNRMTFESYYKLPAPQTPAENCVAHNGSLIPVPGRDIMVQGWYQGGISIFDWTDPANPVEIAYHDRGPIRADRMTMGGSWSVYWYNGLIVNSEIARGLDIFELTPSPWLTRNEIDAAKSVTWDYLNAQGQPHIEWPATYALARAYLDQLERDQGLDAERIGQVRAALTHAEARGGGRASGMLREMAGHLREIAPGAADSDKVMDLAGAVARLAE